MPPVPRDLEGGMVWRGSCVRELPASLTDTGARPDAGGGMGRVASLLHFLTHHARVILLFALPVFLLLPRRSTSFLSHSAACPARRSWDTLTHPRNPSKCPPPSTARPQAAAWRPVGGRRRADAPPALLLSSPAPRPRPVGTGQPKCVWLHIRGAVLASRVIRWRHAPTAWRAGRTHAKGIGLEFSLLLRAPSRFSRPPPPPLLDRRRRRHRGRPDLHRPPDRGRRRRRIQVHPPDLRPPAGHGVRVRRWRPPDRRGRAHLP